MPEMTQEQVTQMVKSGLEASGFTEETAKTLKEVKEVKRAPIGDTTTVKIVEPDKFKSFGEQLKAVYLQSAVGQLDNRLLTSKQLGLNEGVDSMGGFLVAPEFAAGILKNAYETGAVVSRCRKITIGPNSNSIMLNAINETTRVDGSRQGGVLGYWLAEAGTKLPSHPVFRQLTLTLHKVVTLYYATDELLQDTSALEQMCSQFMTEELSFQVENAVFRGNGVGRPLGVLSAPALITQAQVAGQGAGTVVSRNIMDMWSRLSAKSRANAVWFINQDVEPALYLMSQVVGLGGVPTFMPAGGLSGAMYSTLMGKPIIPIEYCSTLGTVGDIVLADMSEYLLADKGGVQAASSIHVQFLTDQQVFRFVYRVDGQPIPNAPLTPFQGTTTTSPFVTLATRV